MIGLHLCRRLKFHAEFTAQLGQKAKFQHKSHICSVLIGVEYRKCRQTLDVYLHYFFGIWMGQIQSKLIYIFVTYGVGSL